jgi:hypothetical protein
MNGVAHQVRASLAVAAAGLLAIACNAPPEPRITVSGLQRATFEAVIALDTVGGPADAIYCTSAASGDWGVDPSVPMDEIEGAVGRRVLPASACAAGRASIDTTKMVSVHFIRGDTATTEPFADLSTIRTGGSVTAYRCTVTTAESKVSAKCLVSAIS